MTGGSFLQAASRSCCRIAGTAKGTVGNQKPILAAALALFAVQAHATLPPCEVEAQLKLDQISERVVLVGETHGNDQAPAFIGRMVCGLLKQNRPVILALERDEAEQAATERFLASAGTPADVHTLLEQAEWNSTMQDGRSSQAMLKLLDQVRMWRRAGQPVRLLMMRKQQRFDVPAGSASAATMDLKSRQAKLDSDMADSVTAALEDHPKHIAVVLAGTFHTAVGSKMHQDMIGAPSMGEVLSARMPVHVIGLSGGAGESWVCFQQNRCGPQSLHAGDWNLPDARTDTRIQLGPITASRPAAIH